MSESDPTPAPTSRGAEYRGARAASNSMVVAVGQVIVLLIALITTPITLHHIGIAEFGIWTFAIAVIGYISVVDPGFNDLVTRFGALARSRGETLVAARICSLGTLAWIGIGLILAPVVIGLTPLVVSNIAHMSPGLRSVATNFLYWSFAMVIFSSILSTLSGRLSAIGEQRVVTIIDVVSRVIYAVVLIGLLNRGWRLSAIVVATSVQMLLSYAATFVWVFYRDGKPYANPRGLDPEVRREVSKFGGWLQLSSLLETMTYETDPLVVGMFVGVGAVSVWGVAQRMARQTTAFASIPQNNILPALSASYGAKEGMETFRRIYVRANSIIVLIGALSAGLIMAYGPLLARAWLGLRPAFAWHTSTATILVSLTFAAGVPRQATAKAIMAMGRVGYGARAQYLAFVINIVLTVSLVYNFGLNGVLFATVVAKIAATSYLLVRFVRLVDSSMSELVWPWLGPIIAVTAVTTVLGHLAMVQWPSAMATQWSALVALIILSVAYVVLFSVGLRVTRFFSLEDLRWIRSIAPGRLGVIISPRLVRILTGIKT